MLDESFMVILPCSIVLLNAPNAISDKSLQRYVVQLRYVSCLLGHVRHPCHSKIERE
jgi:hypothetical protein